MDKIVNGRMWQGDAAFHTEAFGLCVVKLPDRVATLDDG